MLGSLGVPGQAGEPVRVANPSAVAELVVKRGEAIAYLIGKADEIGIERGVPKGRPFSEAADIRNLCKQLRVGAAWRTRIRPGAAGAVYHQARPRTRMRYRRMKSARICKALPVGIRRQFKLDLHLILLTLVASRSCLLAQWPNVRGAEWRTPNKTPRSASPHIVYLSK